MRFPTELHVDELPDILRYFVPLCGINNIQRHLDRVERWTKNNPAASDLLEKRYSIERPLQRLLKVFRNRGAEYQLRKFVLDHSCGELLAFMGAAVHVHRRLSDRGKRAFEGTLRDAFESDAGLGPVAFEIETAVQMIRRGADVFFPDLEGHGRVDLSAVLGGSIVDAECKWLSNDVGRKIHLLSFVHVSETLLPSMSEQLDESVGSHHIELTCEGELKASNPVKEALLAALKDAARAPDASGVTQGISWVRRPLAIPPKLLERRDPQVVGGYLRAALDQDARLFDSNILLCMRSDRLLVVSLKSSAKDRIAAAIYDRLKDSVAKFSPRRANLIFVKMHDLTELNLYDLNRKGQTRRPLDLISARMFRQRERAHVQAISFVVSGSPTEQKALRAGAMTTSYSTSGTCLANWNLQGLYKDDPHVKTLANYSE